MKRFIFVFLVVAFLPATRINSQVVTVGAVTDLLMQKAHADQILYYVDSLAELVKTAEKTEAMFENLEKQFQNQIQNISNISQIHSYKDFMNWYNRQLYLERRTEETWNNMHITIGKKNYKITDAKGIGYGLQDTYIDYWNKEFTEEQRREMWVELGLTPSNYAYISTWRERERYQGHYRLLRQTALLQYRHLTDDLRLCLTV
jgi:hypothetical protein